VGEVDDNTLKNFKNKQINKNGINQIEFQTLKNLFKKKKEKKRTKPN
jgi:hypothetical protein